MVKCPPYWMLLIAGSIRNIPGYALGAWLPTFFRRQYGIEASHYAIPVGLVVLFGGGVGSFIGGFLSDRLMHIIIVLHDIIIGTYVMVMFEY